MINFSSQLSKCILFNNFSEKEILTEFQHINYVIKNFNKNQVIALEDSECLNLGIVLSGSLEVQKIFASGKTVTIESLDTGSIFGEVIIFSVRSTYPSSVISITKSDVIFISKENVLKLCSLNPKFLINFMSLLSNKILTLNKKLKTISFQTIRQKIANFILEQYAIQKSLKLNLPYSKREISEQLGMPRPSLSRELLNMKEDNIVDLAKGVVTIINLETLENILLE